MSYLPPASPDLEGMDLILGAPVLQLQTSAAAVPYDLVSARVYNYHAVIDGERYSIAGFTIVRPANGREVVTITLKQRLSEALELSVVETAIQRDGTELERTIAAGARSSPMRTSRGGNSETLTIEASYPAQYGDRGLEVLIPAPISYAGGDSVTLAGGYHTQLFPGDTLVTTEGERLTVNRVAITGGAGGVTVRCNYNG